MPLGPNDITLTGGTLTGGVVSGSTLSGCTSTNAVVVLSSGQAAVTPLTFQPGALNTASAAGGAEYDGKCFYLSAATSARGIVKNPQMITQTSAFTGTTVLTAQNLFDASTGLNGAVNVGPSVTYMFDTYFTITGRSSTSNTHAFGFGGTAAVDRQGWVSITGSIAASSTPGATLIARGSATNIINTANTLAVLNASITGKVVIGTSGTLIPSITRSAGTVALVVAPDSFFRIWPIGSTAVNRVGNWT
jgi:hypothetical protein